MQNRLNKLYNLINLSNKHTKNTVHIYIYLEYHKIDSELRGAQLGPHYIFKKNAYY
jgi:hypothetical protein